MYNQWSHFIRDFFPLPHQHIKGLSGQIAIKVQGTIRCNIEDDDGILHTLYIKDSLYVPKSLISILYPEHFAQQANNNFST